MALLDTLQVRQGLDTAIFGQKFGTFTKDLETRAKGISKGLSGRSLLRSASIGASLTQGITAADGFEAPHQPSRRRSPSTARPRSWAPRTPP